MQFSFNASQHQARVAGGGAPVLPEGKYPAILAHTEPKQTRAQNGDYFIEATFIVTDGEHRGQKIVQRYNVQNSNVTAMDLAFGELACLSLAVGVMQWQDTNQLCNRPLILDIGMEDGRPWRDQQGNERPGNKQNRIRGYYTAQGVDATTLGQAPQPAAAPAQAAPYATAPQPWAAPAPAQAPAAAGAPAFAAAPPWAGQPAAAPAPTAPTAAQPQQPPWGAPTQPAAGAMPPWGNPAGGAAPAAAAPAAPPWAQPQG